MKQHRSRSIQYILEHRVRSGFPDSTAWQCKNDKRILNNTEKITTILLYSFGWLISPLFDQFPCLGDFFQAKLF